MNVNQWRSQTPGCKSKVHFNNAGASLMPQPVVQSIANHIQLETMEGGYEAADLVEDEIPKFYQAVASLIGAKADQIAFTSSATNSFARALSSIPFQKGDKILIANEDYVSNQLAFMAMAKRLDIILVRVPSLPTGGVDVDALQSYAMKHKPKLVSLTHVPTNSGLVQPVAEVGRICRELEIPYLVDACQSAGQLPLDVNEIGCDFLSATFRKFLRGPRGAGFLFISDRILKKNWFPLFIDMRGADWIANNDFSMRPDAIRFEDWELPYALLLGSRMATEYALQVGIEEIVIRNAKLCNLVREQLRRLNLVILDHGKILSSIITVSIPTVKPETLIQELRKRNINTSISYKNYAWIDFDRKGVEWALRISPHYFNTEEEVDYMIRKLEEVLEFV